MGLDAEQKSYLIVALVSESSSVSSPCERASRPTSAASSPLGSFREPLLRAPF